MTPGMTPGMTGETIAVIRSGEPVGTDRYGNPIPGPTTGHQVHGCAIEPVGSQEPVEVGRQAIHTRLTVYAPAGADVQAGDQLDVRGRRYDVDGNPGLWRNPYTGRRAGIEIHCVQVRG